MMNFLNSLIVVKCYRYQDYLNESNFASVVFFKEDTYKDSKKDTRKEPMQEMALTLLFMAKAPTR